MVGHSGASTRTARWHYFGEITKIVLKTKTFICKFCFSHDFFVFLYDEEEYFGFEPMGLSEHLA